MNRLIVKPIPQRKETPKNWAQARRPRGQSAEPRRIAIQLKENTPTSLPRNRPGRDPQWDRLAAAAARLSPAIGHAGIGKSEQRNDEDRRPREMQCRCSRMWSGESSTSSGRPGGGSAG